MGNRPLILGLIVCVVLVLIPIAMGARLIYGITSGYFARRRAESCKVAVDLPGLGEFSSTDNQLWLGQVRGVHITLDSLGPPVKSQIDRGIHLLDNLPVIAALATQYLTVHEDISWLAGGPTKFEVFGLEPISNEAFVVEFIHPSDPDGVYRVEFRDGSPTASGRDD